MVSGPRPRVSGFRGLGFRGSVIIGHVGNEHSTGFQAQAT